ncbi:MAG: class I SAM-dependent methyltransferase [Candidatus Binataceae bacterium]
MASYDQIGSGYSRTRRADARIVERITALLSLPIGSRVVDVGAGTGNYSNAIAEKGCKVIAVEPSSAMRAQAHAHPSVVWRAGSAEALPLPDAAVDGAICILAFHHFSDHRQALREMRRATGGGPIVLFTWEPRATRDFWLFDYFPDIHKGDDEMFPPLESVAAMVEKETGLRSTVTAFALPRDMADLFAAAGWAGPELYLDPQVRAGMSGFAIADQSRIAIGVERLKADLASGAWFTRHGHLMARQTFDAGYRFIHSS